MQLKSTIISLLCLSSFSAFSQNSIDLKLGYSFLSQQDEQANNYPLGGMFNLGFTFHRFSMYTGIELNRRSEHLYGEIDTLPHSNMINTSGYSGPTLSDNVYVIHNIPVYFGYTVISKKKLKFIAGNGLHFMFENYTSKYTLINTGETFKGSFRSDNYYMVSFETEIQYLVSNKIGIYLINEIKYPIFSTGYFLSGKIGVKYNFLSLLSD